MAEGIEHMPGGSGSASASARDVTEFSIADVVGEIGGLLADLISDGDIAQIVSEQLAGDPQDYVDDQKMFIGGLKEALKIRLERSAVGGKGWQELGMVGVVVQVIHKARRLINQTRPSEEVMSVAVNDPERMLELKNIAIDIANYGIMLAGMIVQWEEEQAQSD